MHLIKKIYGPVLGLYQMPQKFCMEPLFSNNPFRLYLSSKFCPQTSIFFSHISWYPLQALGLISGCLHLEKFFPISPSPLWSFATSLMNEWMDASSHTSHLRVKHVFVPMGSGRGPRHSLCHARLWSSAQGLAPLWPSEEGLWKQWPCLTGFCSTGGRRKAQYRIGAQLMFIFEGKEERREEKSERRKGEKKRKERRGGWWLGYLREILNSENLDYWQFLSIDSSKPISCLYSA